LGNAIKFTEVGDITIEIKCLHITVSKVDLEFRVIDTGIGIPKDLQARVFDRFFRVTSSYKGRYTGHGLRLHIAQSYVKLLGSHIKLISEEGVGSTFYFHLQCQIGEKKIATDLAPPCSLAGSIREREKTMKKTATPILGLTSHTQEIGVAEAKKSGMDDVLFQLAIFPTFDEKYALQQVNDPSLLFEILSDFVSDKMQDDIHLMKQAYVKQAWDEVEKITHKIKGGVSYIGARKLEAACENFEIYYKQGYHASLDKLYFQMLEVHTQTLEAVTAWLQAYAKSHCWLESTHQ
jgi:HPt (histidine-containing phosphotransfer) domain-containing protein